MTSRDSPLNYPDLSNNPLMPSLQVCPLATTLLNLLLEDLLHITLRM